MSQSHKSTSRPEEVSAPVAAEAEDLSVIRGKTTILDRLNFTLPAGGCTVILGPNGCGKTTLARCLTGHMFVTSGRVRVLGQIIGQTDMRALRQRIGVVSPTVDAGEYHYAGSVVDSDLTTLEAVVTGIFSTVGLYDQPTRAQKDYAAHLLEQVGLGHRMDLRFALLSTGEQRRAIIARALVRTPELLILDEPTAGLDLAGREHVLATIDMILARPQPPALLLITHHVEEISPRTRQVMLIKQGRIVACGSAREIITPESLTQTFGCKVFVKKIHGRYWLEVLPEAWVELARHARDHAR